jgi:hypothetical protein
VWHQATKISVRPTVDPTAVFARGLKKAGVQELQELQEFRIQELQVCCVFVGTTKNSVSPSAGSTGFGIDASSVSL